MDYETLKENNIETLLKGYAKNDEGKYQCLYCGEEFSGQGSAGKHMKEAHQDTPFYEFLSASSLLPFSHVKRVAYNMIYNGAKDDEIAEALDLKPNYVRSITRDARKNFARAKAEVVFFSALFHERGPGKYQQRKPTTAMLRELVPWLDEDSLRIAGFMPKIDLHETGKLHGTTLILAIDISKPDPLFVVGNKAAKVISGGRSPLRYYDIYGGHVSVEDILPASQLSKIKSVEDIKLENRTLNRDDFDHCGMREIIEEMPEYKPGVPLRLLFDVRYDGSDPLAKRNKEWTFIYALVLEDSGISAEDVRMQERAIDSLGRPGLSKFPVEAIRYSKLMKMYRKKPTDKVDNPNFADGLGRVLRYFDEQNYTGEDIIRLVREAK
ncbi:MAG: hypothetical protein ACOX2M_08490 [Fastidiosipilaceae bacterium]|jgi:hypothetical protein